MKNLLMKILNLGPLDGYKTILAAFLMLCTKFIPGFPVIDLAGGVTPEQLLLLLAAFKKLLERARGKM